MTLSNLWTDMLHTEFLGELQSRADTVKVGARHHELGAADLLGPADDSVEVVWMPLFAMVVAAKDWVCQIDADLLDTRLVSLMRWR